VGCGTGGFAETLRALVPDLELWGVEPVESAADVARGAYDKVITGFFPDDAGELPPASFDAIYLLDVIEHLPDPEPALRAATSLVAPGGVLVASIPNVRHFDVWWPLVRHGTWTYTDTGPHPPPVVHPLVDRRPLRGDRMDRRHPRGHQPHRTGRVEGQGHRRARLADGRHVLHPVRRGRPPRRTDPIGPFRRAHAGVTLAG
jgi:SAM-dependent methyltransferase